MATLSIDHVELFVPDRREAARWYRETLGLEILADFEFWAEDPGGPLMISPDGGGTKLALFTGEPRGERATAGYHRVAFRVDASTCVDHLARLKAEAVDHEQAFSCYFTDPWGHRLEITTYELE